MAVVGEKKRLSLKRSRGSDIQQDKEIKMEPRTKEEEDDAMMLPHCRLINLGNTCYLNAVVQCLKFSPRFKDMLDEAVLQNEHLLQEFTQLLSLMEKMETSNQKKVIDPSNFVASFQEVNTQFVNGLQHDSLECLNVLFGRLQVVTTTKRRDTHSVSSHRQVSGQITQYFNITPVSKNNKITVKAPPTSGNIVSDLFEGQLIFGTKCMICETIQNCYEKFTHISLPVTSNVSNQCGPYSIHWSLSQFASIEYLRKHNKYFCQNCLHYTEARHTVSIDKLPNIVILHLNRFSTMTWSVTKTTGNIGIPTYLTFEEWCSPDCDNKQKMYKLYSVILHTGLSCNSGHYTALVKVNESWILFNDDQIQLLTCYQFSDIISPLTTSCTPYILFYSIKS